MKTILELGTADIRQVLDCASPLALSARAVIHKSKPSSDTKRQRTGALQSLAVVALVLLAHAAFAQTWQTALDFQYVAGYRSWDEGLAVAPSGTLFASGFADTSTNCLEIVVASQDDGATWFGPLDISVASSAPALGGAPIASDANGTLYVSHAIQRRFNALAVGGQARHPWRDQLVNGGYLYVSRQ